MNRLPFLYPGLPFRRALSIGNLVKLSTKQTRPVFDKDDYENGFTHFHRSSYEKYEKQVKIPTAIQRTYLSYNTERIVPTGHGITSAAKDFDQTKFEILLRRRFIFDQSYEIYGRSSGLMDLGPVGCALKANLLAFWRKFFVLEERMLEIDCPALTSEKVFETSGHTKRFTDYVVRDGIDGKNIYRVDHLVESHLAALLKMSDTKWKDYTVKMHITRSQVIEDLTKLHSCDLDGLKLLLMKYAIKDPKSGCDLTEPEKFNLMFSTELGPYTTSKTRGYLRPETSQGIFVNFKRLLDYNHGRVPFAAAQIGNAFRNEINPRGLLRVREFTIAEIEHFTDPEDKTHPKFKSISDIELTLYSRCHQNSKQKPVRMKIRDAVSQGLIKSETFGYFLIRIQEFLLRVGISADRLRFRQHSVDEMAHYAEDCWDAECLTSHGWIECVGCADRTDYDLLKHATATRSNLKYKKPLKKSIEREDIKVAARSSFLKSLNKTEQNAIKSRLERITTPEELDDFKKSLECE